MTRRRRRAFRAAHVALLVGVTGLGSGAVLAFGADRTLVPLVHEALRSERLRVRTVSWLGLRALRADDLTPLLGLAPGTPLVDVDPEALCTRVARHARVERCAALRVPPDRVLVRVVERDPVGRIAGAREAFDASGERFPLLDGERERLTPVRGEPEGALPLLAAARRHGLRIEALEVRTLNDVRLRLEGWPVRLRVDADAARALDDWLELDAAGVIERYRPEEVDLRFRGSAVLRGVRAPTRGGEHVSSRGTDRRS